MPDSIVTAGPPFRHESMPPEVALLLPNSGGASGVIAATARTAAGPADGAGRQALGLFLADPFLNLAAETGELQRAGISCLANLPSVQQHDPDFAQQLEDVGLDFAREVDRLGQLKAAGFQVIAIVAGPGAAAAVAPLDPLAVVVIPRVADFAAGFPSFRQRGVVAQQVAAALAESEWRGNLLGLASAGEGAHETLWPDVLDAVLCRPEPLAAAGTLSP
ncbi:hypothetical protein [Pelagibius sp. 7325]|uniref:hypothetical protein n=1 Tax=Pelagibius sp. 7325 TaxID=3131994 RepID=UPI0030EDBF3C